jgi:putative transposase
LSNEFDIAPLCRLLGVSREGYYAWQRRLPSKRSLYNMRLVQEMRIIDRQVKGVYGSPRMTAELNRRGYVCGENKIAQLMRKHGIRAKMDRRYKPRQWAPSSLIRKPNLLENHPGPSKRHEIWVADFTYFSTVMDLCTRKILGSTISSQRNADMALVTLKKAIKSASGRCPKIFHSDRGIEYANYLVHHYLKDRGVKQSMSGKGNCYDNAHMESFFHTYKSEFYYHERFATLKEFKQKTMNYLQFYNRRRLHSSLGFQSPTDFELQAL